MSTLIEHMEEICDSQFLGKSKSRRISTFDVPFC